MEAAGLWMLALVPILVIATGLPAFAVLIGLAVVFAAIGLAAGAVSYSLLTALPARVVGLLENDLLQALPLFVLMGALLNRLPLADVLFRAGTGLFARTPSAPHLTAIGLGAVLAPMNGSVGASVATLSRTVQPRLLAGGVAAGPSLALVCVSSTLGVVVPPSLVLILLSDAMLRAHTEAVNATGQAVRIINTQDVFRGALVPAGLFLLLCLGVAWWSGRRSSIDPPPPPTAGERLGFAGWLTAGATLIFITGLLAAVTIGYIYAVEAAAFGAAALLLFGIVTRSLRAEVLDQVLRDTMAVTGALFALFVAANTFTLVFRIFGTDRLLDVLIGGLPGGAVGSSVVVLLLLGACAFVLDAFEIIFVIIPVVMPPLLMRAPDAVWLSVLTLLTLQASFLVPPFGYAVMTARTMMAKAVPTGALARAMAPFLGAQALVFILVVIFPGLTHLAEPESAMARTTTRLSDEDVQRQFDSIVPAPPPEESPEPQSDP